MPHIHTKPGQHDHTASAYIIRTDFDKQMIMLHMHKKLKKWMQFGGHIELDENPWQTLTHELLEETGYDMDQLQIMQPKDRLKKLKTHHLHPVPISFLTHAFNDEPHYHTDIAFLFITSQAPRHAIGKNESPAINLYSQAEIQNLDTYDSILEVANFAFDTALPKWEAVDTSTFN